MSPSPVLIGAIEQHRVACVASNQEFVSPFVNVLKGASHQLISH